MFDYNLDGARCIAAKVTDATVAANIKAGQRSGRYTDGVGDLHQSRLAARIGIGMAMTRVGEIGPAREHEKAPRDALSLAVRRGDGARVGLFAEVSGGAHAELAAAGAPLARPLVLDPLPRMHTHRPL